MDRIPGSERTRERLKALTQGRGEAAARTEEFHHQTARQTREGGGLHPPYVSVFSAAAKCAWSASAGVALICVVAVTAVQGQTGSDVADDRAGVTESICRQYAAALTNMPADLMFKQCMFERHCQPVQSPPGYWCEPPQPMQVKTWLITGLYIRPITGQRCAAHRCRSIVNTTRHPATAVKSWACWKKGWGAPSPCGRGQRDSVWRPASTKEHPD